MGTTGDPVRFRHMNAIVRSNYATFTQPSCKLGAIPHVEELGVGQREVGEGGGAAVTGRGLDLDSHSYRGTRVEPEISDELPMPAVGAGMEDVGLPKAADAQPEVR